MTDNNSKTKKIRSMSKELKRILTISGVSLISLGVITSIFLVNISANNTSNLNNINNNLLEQNIKNKKVKLFDMFNNKIINFEISEDTKTVRDILENSDYNNNNCICNYDLDTPVHENMNIFVRKTVSINIQENNKTKSYFVPENISIKKALELLEINLSEHDIINFNINENIYENINIIINRISYDELTYTEPIEYTTITRKDYTLEKNSKKIISEGQNGERELKIKRKIVNGEIISTEVLSSKVTKPAREHIILIGAKPENNYNYNKNTKNTKQKLNSEENTNNTNINIKNTKDTEHEVIKVISGCATAYTDSGGIIRPDGRVITSTGKVPQEGITAAVNPKIIPYGSKIRVRTTDGSFDKILYAQDTGGALKSGSATVDIYMKNKKDCLNFGRRKVEVSVLK